MLNKKPSLLKKENIDTLAKEKIILQVGNELMDLDYISQKIVGVIPDSSYEMKYRQELRWNTRVNIFLTLLGFLMFMSVIMTII